MPDWLQPHHPWHVILIRLVIALVCGAVVGFDREQRGLAAGLRTHMLIALGAATFALVGMELIEQLRSRNPDTKAGEYVLHVVAAVVGGVGFLGAGAIIESRGHVIGLTTAAGIWTVAGVGVAAGLGFHLIALITTAMAFITLSLVKRLEPREAGKASPNNARKRD